MRRRELLVEVEALRKVNADLLLKLAAAECDAGSCRSLVDLALAAMSEEQAASFSAFLDDWTTVRKLDEAET